MPHQPEQAYEQLKLASEMALASGDKTLYLAAINSLTVLSQEASETRQQEVVTLLSEAFRQLLDYPRDSSLAELHFQAAKLAAGRVDVDDAVYHFQTAKGIWTRLYGEESRPVADCYYRLGDIYKYVTYEFYEAEKCYERALSIREKINLADDTVLYKSYYNLAATNRSQRDYEKALSYGVKALTIAERLKRNKSIEMTNAIIANIYRDMGDVPNAYDHYLTAIRFNERTQDPGNRAWLYASVGEMQLKNQRYQEALNSFWRAHTLYDPRKDPVLFVNLLQNMVDTYATIDDQENLHRISREAFEWLSKLGMLQSTEAYVITLILGRHQYEKGSYDSALYYYNEAIRAAIPDFKPRDLNENPSEEMIGYAYYLYDGFVKKAAALEALYYQRNDSKALKHVIACLQLAERLLSKARNELDLEQAKWEFLDTNYNIYERLLSAIYLAKSVLPADSVDNLAFRYLERSKSRSLADALAQAGLRDQIIEDDSLFKTLGDLKRRLFETQAKISNLVKDAGTDDGITRLRSDVVLLDRQIQSIKLSIEQKYPGYFHAKYGMQAIGLSDAFPAVAHDDERQMLVEYFWGDNSVFGMAVADGQARFERLGNPDSIHGHIDSLLTHFAHEHAAIQLPVFQRYTRNAHALYDVLLGPFAGSLASVDRLLIVPDGPIAQLPFELLLTEFPPQTAVNYRSLHYLVKTHTVGYAYAVAMLINGRERTVRAPRVLGVGFTGGRRLRDPDSELEEIVGAEREMESLARRFADGKFLLGPDATESNFKIFSPDYDIIHLAIHGRGNADQRFSSSLYFRSRPDTVNDGELHSYELYGLKLQAVMAVLTSCESGIGKSYKGEGMISMASAFAFSGCRNILMSLWKVNDQASTTLMDEFYEGLQQGERIDDALRRAKLKYLADADEITADPAIWGSLVAYGSLTPILDRVNYRRYIVIAIVSIAAILAVVFFVRRRGRL